MDISRCKGSEVSRPAFPHVRIAACAECTAKSPRTTVESCLAPNVASRADGGRDHAAGQLMGQGEGLAQTGRALVQGSVRTRALAIEAVEIGQGDKGAVYAQEVSE